MSRHLAYKCRREVYILGIFRVCVAEFRRVWHILCITTEYTGSPFVFLTRDLVSTLSQALSAYKVLLMRGFGGWGKELCVCVEGGMSIGREGERGEKGRRGGEIREGVGEEETQQRGWFWGMCDVDRQTDRQPWWWGTEEGVGGGKLWWLDREEVWWIDIVVVAMVTLKVASPVRLCNIMWVPNRGNIVLVYSGCTINLLLPGYEELMRYLFLIWKHPSSWNYFIPHIKVSVQLKLFYTG